MSNQGVFSAVTAGVNATLSASGKWMFRCPLSTHGRGRGDRRPSAEVFEDEKGQIGAVCYAGCDNRELWVAAVGSYLDTGSGAPRQGRDNADDYLIAVYQHPDGKPRKVFRQDCPGQEVCTRRACKNREPGKHIWQTRGSNNGCYILLWGNDEGNGPVVICEGEKAAQAVARAGFTGASWIGGAARAGQPDYSRLSGRHVLVWPDNDKPGVKAAQVAAEKAAEWTASVTILPALDGPDGWDAADVSAEEVRKHIDAGGPSYKPGTPFRSPSAVGPDRPFGDNHVTPVATAKRFILKEGYRLLVSWDHRQLPEIFGDNGSGCWSDRSSDLEDYLATGAAEFAQDATAAYMAGEIPLTDHRMAVSWAKRGQGPVGWHETILSVGASVLALEREGRLPAGLTQARDMDLDQNKRYLGAPNGVIDLDTGELLTGQAARAKLITCTVPDPYNPKAQHPAVDGLLAHLEEEHRDWILAAVAYALRGNPNRRIYVLEGPPGGGKTTLLNAIRACLGSVKGGGYGFTLQENALVADYRANANSHTAHLMDFTAGRVATASDIPTNRKLDTPLLKRISGTEYLATRDVGMRAEAERVATATLFIAMNPGGLEVMDLTDPGLFERIRILPYPELPPDRPKDRDLAMNVISEPAIRQAMLALLVRYAVANRWPPDDIPSVAQARQAAQDSALGDGGDWIKTYVMKGRPMDVLMTNTLWAAALDAAGDGGDGTTAFGLKRASFMKRVGHITGVWAAKPHRVGQTTGRGWAGWKLLTAEEVAAGQDGQTYCGRCEKSFDPLLAEAYCQDCIAFA